MTECERLQAYLEEYALGVLEGEERSEITAHLARRCPNCTLGLEEARRLVSQLSFLAPEVEPPAEIRRNLHAAVATRPARRGWLPAWAWATAFAGFMLLFLLSAQHIRNLRAQNLDLEAQLRELSAQAAMYHRAMAIMSSAGTRPVALTSTQPAAPQLRAFWNETTGLVLTAQNMPALAANRTYQLWVIPKQGMPVSAGIFQPDTGGSVLLISGAATGMAQAAALAITNEPAGGRPQPTTTPIWVGPLS